MCIPGLSVSRREPEASALRRLAQCAAALLIGSLRSFAVDILQSHAWLWRTGFAGPPGPLPVQSCPRTMQTRERTDLQHTSEQINNR
eukprot:1880743-Amphidinium_carterae.1